jgi:hypothetical protein
MKKRAQSSVGVFTDAFVQRPSSEGRKTRGEGAGYTARTDEGVETKTPVRGNACLAKTRQPKSLVPLLRPLAAGSGFQRDRQRLRATHEQVQYTEHAAPNSKGKRTKPRWGAHAVGRQRQRRLGKHGTVTHEPRVRPTQGNARSAEPLAPNTQERTHKVLHPTQCVALAGVSSGAAEKGPMAQCYLRTDRTSES